MLELGLKEEEFTKQRAELRTSQAKRIAWRQWHRGGKEQGPLEKQRGTKPRRCEGGKWEGTKMGCRDECAGPQTTSRIPQFSPRDHGKPLQDGAQGWQDKIFTERDQKHWKRPE